MSKITKFRVPASTANLGAGFDALGLALDRYLRVSVERASEMRIEASGVDRERIATDATNLIVRVADTVAWKRGGTLPRCHLSIVNGIPLARGMGSSAAAIIAGITVYEILFDTKLPEDELLRYALEFEPHPDNLAAALYGGLIAGAVSDDGNAMVSKLPIREGLQGVLVIPSFELPTGKSRAALPDSYSREDAVYNLQRSALTIAAFASGSWGLLREGMRDRIHQPYRARLIPGLEDILELNCDGLLAVALSGAGPTVIAFAEPSKAAAVGDVIVSIFTKNGITSSAHLTGIDTMGRVVES